MAKQTKPVVPVSKQDEIDKFSLRERLASPTPKFFKKLKIVGLALAAASGALIAAPIVLPVAVVTLAGYIALAGAVVTAVSQVAVEG